MRIHKITRRNFMKVAGVSALAMGLAACGGSSSSTAASTSTAASASTAAGGEVTGDKVVINIGHINDQSDSWHQGALKFKEYCEANSNGTIEVDVFPNSQLGPEVDMIQGILSDSGTVDITFTGESMQTYVEELGIIGMPYAITSDEHMDAVLEGDVGKELEDLMLQAGLRSLGAVKRGPRYITSNKEIHTPADLQGFIIRTPESKMTMAAFEAMGAKPTPMAFSEIFTSLQQGVIHGQENPLANIYDASLYEVQDYIIGTEHLRAWVYMAISEARFSSFSEAAQQLIQECATEAIAYEHELFLEDEAQLLTNLEEKGMTYIEVDQEPFKEKAVAGVLAVLSDKQKAIYDKMVAADPANN